ncbi:hypothetical protein [Streptomyces liliifuscus]|uniref:Uncharacterized protein n=1 Tax=Streptomyces liliifuscus TaxID=2797636 RepID=A0A7T7RFP8_9ACTN|nr:hypothetical protein [Streptomyces liliifuscus]QQM44982.1 hypothetical protein JEQ17_39995 [Streptomyces liliifuscus]
MSAHREQLALLPDDPPAYGGPAAVPSVPIRTSGRTEYSVQCTGPSGCGEHHRHTGPGVRMGPCGAEYTVPAVADAPDPP